MNQSAESWVDIVSPVVTFIAVILVPIGVAAWVIARTLARRPRPGPAPAAAPPAQVDQDPPASTGDG